MESAPPADVGYNRALIVVISLIATIGGFLFGFDSGVINGTVDGLRSAFDSDSVGTGFNVASMLLGCAAGAFFAGGLADRYGRRTILIVAAAFFAISAWGSGVAGSSFVFVVYRIIGGLAVGSASVLSPAYISEVTPAHIRGRMTTIQQIAIICGLFIALLSNYLVAGVAGSSLAPFWLGFEAWRWMFWIELFPAVAFFVLLLFIPESPRYLAARGQYDKAEGVLTRIFGAAGGPAKLADIRASLSDDHRPRLSDLVDKATGRVRAIVWIGIGLALLQQLVGINVIFYYGAVLWQAVGFSESDALLTNVVSGGLSIAAAFVALSLIDRIGRKPLLVAGSIGMTATLATATLVFSSGSLGADGNLVLGPQMNMIALIAANLFVVIFNGTWGPVTWVLLAEMFPNQIRGSGLAVSGLALWMANFAITMTFPIMLGSIGLAAAYGIYAAFAALSIYFVLRFVRETSGVELEDMVG